MMQKLLTFLVLFSMLFLTSCEDFFEQTIELDVPEHEPVLAVTAIFGLNESTYPVRVASSVGALKDHASTFINNAIVTLSGNGEEILFEHLTNGYYYPLHPLNLQEGERYTLQVSASGFETVRASQVLPQSIGIIEASINSSNLKLKWQDDANAKNYYAVRAKLIIGPTSSQSSTINLEPFGTIAEVSEIDYSSLLLSDETYNGDEFELIASHYREFVAGDSVLVSLYHVTEDFYRFDRTAYASSIAEDNPFAEPVILHRNFDNGYGVFAFANRTQLKIATE